MGNLSKQILAEKENVEIALSNMEKFIIYKSPLTPGLQRGEIHTKPSRTNLLTYLRREKN